MATAFEAGSILIGIRTASAQAIQGLARVKAGLKSLGVSAIGVSKIVNAAGRRMQRTFAALGRMVKRFARIAKFALLAAGVAAGKMAVDFEASLSKIVGLVGVSREQVNAWRDDILEMGKVVGKGPTELADAMFFVTSAGLRGAEALETLKASAKAATAGLGETKIVADAVTSALNAYAGTNLTAADAAGVLVAAVREGKAEADTLATAFGRVLPVASALGVTFDQVGAALAAMTRLGLSADESATSLRSTLNLILKPGADAQKALDLVGLSTEKLQEKLRGEGLIAVLQDLKAAFEGNEGAIDQVFPNVRALTGVLALVGNSADKARGIFERMADAGVRDLDKAFAEAETTMRVRFLKTFANVQASLIRIGDELLPAVVPVFEAIASQFESLSKKAAGFAAVVAEVINSIRDSIAKGGVAEVLQKLISSATDLLVAFVETTVDFLGKSADKILKLFFKAVVAIAGPSAIKIGRLVLEKMKATVKEGLILLGGPFRWAVDQVNNLIRIADAKFLRFMSDARNKAADLLDLLPAFLGQKSLVKNLRGGAAAAADMAFVVEQGVLTVAQVTEKAIARTDALLAAVAADTLEATNRVKAEIDAIETGLRDSGVLKDITDEAVRLFRSGVDLFSEAGRKALKEIADKFGLDVDVILAKLRAVVAKAPPFISPGGAPGAPTDTGTKEAARSTGQIIAAAVREGLEAQQAVIADTLASAVARGVISGIRRGAKAIEILADIGRQLFEKALTDAIESFKVAMTKAITELAGESEGLINGILNAAIALVGFLLSQLDKGSDSSRRFGRVGPEVDSSQLVRGVISGPTNVAIAEVGENLKRALSGVEERLDVIIGFLFEARDGFAFRGAALAPAAGNAATP